MSQEVRRVGRELDRFVERQMVALTLDITANLQETTPVDTGWARANWVPSIGKPFKGTSGSAAQARSGNISMGDQQTGIATVATSYRIERGAIHITNNVPYINRLNEGSSGQEPSGFVQRAISRAVSRVIRGTVR